MPVLAPMRHLLTSSKTRVRWTVIWMAHPLLT